MQRTVNVGLLDSDDYGNGGVAVGDWVLIHVGFAISKIDEAEAAETLEMLEHMGNPYELELAEFQASAIQ